MDVDFDIVPDPRHNMMRVRMTGFFDQEQVRQFAAAYRSALAGLTSPGHLTLVDITAMKIQAQDVVAAFSGLLAAPDVRSRKLAFLCGSTLARLQAQRLTDRDGVCFFEDPVAAERWLLA
ncbi:hypothetical protein [Sphingobium sp. Leaf26]|uniref:hypothetical protein n=1 Tax=Sphingobium sp. Leaf26 TaxID=1735693 RepID=UPI000ACCD0F6|nr:hypothetical protein [Sphingobium sp. Leaf26]